MSLLSTLNWWVTNGILLDNSTDSSFFLLTPLDHTPYRRIGMSYQVAELVVPALAHVKNTPNRQYNSTMKIKHRLVTSVWLQIFLIHIALHVMIFKSEQSYSYKKGCTILPGCRTCCSSPRTCCWFWHHHWLWHYVRSKWLVEHRWAASKDQTDCLILCWILLCKSATDVSWIKVI
jgi:hypothetical protein